MSKAVRAVGGAAKGAVKKVASPMGALNPFWAAQVGGAQGASGTLSPDKQMNIPGIGLSEAARSQARMSDISKGREFAQSVIPAGSLGRLGEQADIKSSLEVLRGQLGGFTAPELQAQRDIAGQGINRATELARRRLGAAQARAGVRGATAGQQQAGVIQQGIQQTADMERQLMMGQRGEQARAATALLGAAQPVSQFDLSQAARERFAELSSGLGFAQLGSAERGGQLGAQASIAAAQAQRPSGGLLGGILGK